ncbi:hypothetical protein ALC57_12202 [Trachymyrmex cornetzi]|uniref:Uncharacterized protein n=1 Tax=Trachymyrmex cornetzi TaxID=471704 RepID=A0A151J184_9HYME|nr:hypothetical protein ALC57_12202 [Trachymyrmex cornetzi]
MAGRREIGNPSVSVNPRVINNITERNMQQYLLLSTTYPLNSSHKRNYTWDYNQQRRESLNLSSN